MTEILNYKCIRCGEYLHPDTICPCVEVKILKGGVMKNCCKAVSNLTVDMNWTPEVGLDQYLVKLDCKICNNSIFINLAKEYNIA